MRESYACTKCIYSPVNNKWLSRTTLAGGGRPELFVDDGVGARGELVSVAWRRANSRATHAPTPRVFDLCLFHTDCIRVTVDLTSPDLFTLVKHHTITFRISSQAFVLQYGQSFKEHCIHWLRYFPPLRVYQA